ncbi:MAG: porin [Brachymonas sp.]|nr:porin [Brachymonas sp.]
MKKSLIALAALAAVSAATAQSSVTMYGVVDTGYGYKKNTVKLPLISGAKLQTSSWGVNSGTLQGSRLGFKGEEALGNGLSAVFALEMGFDSASGATKSAFDRRAVVGLKGSFGEVLVGRDGTPLNEWSGSYKAVDGTDTFPAALDGVDVSGLSLGSVLGMSASYTGRTSGLFYNGAFSGVNVRAVLGHNGSTTKVGGAETGKTNSTVVGVSMDYATGPLSVGGVLQYETGKAPVGGLVGTLFPGVFSYDMTKTDWGLGASYELNVAKLYGEYKGGQVKTKAYDGGAVWGGKLDFGKTTHHQLAVGVAVPLGAATLGAEYAYNKADYTVPAAIMPSSPKFSAKGHEFAVQGNYAFSKRTDVYARIARSADVKLKVRDAGVSHTILTGNTQQYTVGIRHKF